VDAAAGGRTTVRIELAPSERRIGQLAIKSRLPGAEVLVDGGPVGTTPLPGTVALLAGPHKVEIRRPGYRSAATELLLGEGATAEVTLEPEEDPAGVRALGGVLALEISESDAVVEIDGRSRGVYLTPLALAPGSHRLRVQRGGYEPVERQVNVAPRSTTTLQVELEPTPETRASYVSKAKTFRTLGWIGVAGGAALATGGVVFLIYNQGNKDEARDAVKAFNVKTEAPNGACYVNNPEYNERACKTEQSRVEDEQDAAYARDALGWVGVGVGAALAATGVVLLFTGDDPGRYDRPPAGWDTVARGVDVVPVASIGSGRTWLGMAGRF